MRILSISAASAVFILGSLFPANGSAQKQTLRASAAEIVQIANYAANIEDAARRFDLPPLLIGSVIAEESGGDASAVSPKGALGLMQLMPRTYADMSSLFGLGADPFDPHDNIVAGTAYLRRMLDRFGESGFLAAYNVGPGRYEAHLETGEELPRETLNYVSDIESKQFEAADRFQTRSKVATSQSSPTRAISDDGSWQSASLFATEIARSSTDGSITDAAMDVTSSVLRTSRTSEVEALFPSTISTR